MTNTVNGVTNLAESVSAEESLPLYEILDREWEQGHQLWQTVQTWVMENGISFLVNVAIALILIAVGALLIRVLLKTIRTALDRTKRVNPLLEKFILSVISKTSWILLILVAVQRLGINIGPFIAGLGVTGFILGFAFQESLGNLASGIMIALNQPFAIGDYVQLGTIEGSVTDLNMMATTLATADNKKVVIPNKAVWGAPITNYNALKTRRVDLAIGIAYGEDIDLARKVILEAVNKHPLVLSQPTPTVEIVKFGASSVDFCVRPWAKTTDYWQVFFDVNQSIIDALNQAKIEVPFPQLDIHMREGAPKA